MKHHFLWLICMVECMWWGMVYTLVGFGGYVNLQIRRYGKESLFYHAPRPNRLTRAREVKGRECTSEIFQTFDELSKATNIEYLIVST